MPRQDVWRPIDEWRRGKSPIHVIGFHPRNFGVAEYRHGDDGWHVAAFNGQIIKQEPQWWTPMPAAPELD